MKTKALISFAVTAKLICVFVFAHAKSRFSHDEAQIISNVPKMKVDSSKSLECESLLGLIGLKHKLYSLTRNASISNVIPYIDNFEK